jgi:hypothetical protein
MMSKLPSRRAKGIVYYLFQSNVAHFGTAHFIALIIGFLGITGNLPFAALMGKLKS